MKPKNDLLLRVAKSQPVDRTPVWIMGQSRLTHPDWKTLLKKPEAIAEATLTPLKEFALDAAELASDPMTIPHAMGLEFSRSETGHLELPIAIRQPKDLDILQVPQVDTFEAISKGLQLIKSESPAPVISVIPAPWTLFSWMTEGRESGLLSNARSLLYDQPEMSHKLLQLITSSTLNLMKAQVKAGVDMVQLADHNAWVLGQTHYQRFGMEYLAQICDGVYEIPLIVYARGARHSLESLGSLNCQVIHLDWTMHVKDSWTQVGYQLPMQGNLDPAVLFADKYTLQDEVRTMLEYFGPGKHIANLGDYILPNTPREGIEWMIEAVQEHQYTVPY